MGSSRAVITVNQQQAESDASNILSEVNGLNASIVCNSCETNITAIANMSNAAETCNSCVGTFQKCLTKDAKNIITVAERLIQNDVAIAAKIQEAFQ